MGDKELPLLGQVQLETEMNTYLVGPSNRYQLGALSFKEYIISKIYHFVNKHFPLKST